MLRLFLEVKITSVHPDSLCSSVILRSISFYYSADAAGVLQFCCSIFSSIYFVTTWVISVVSLESLQIGAVWFFFIITTIFFFFAFVSAYVEVRRAFSFSSFWGVYLLLQFTELFSLILPGISLFYCIRFRVACPNRLKTLDSIYFDYYWLRQVLVLNISLWMVYPWFFWWVFSMFFPIVYTLC